MCPSSLQLQNEDYPTLGKNVFEDWRIMMKNHSQTMVKSSYIIIILINLYTSYILLNAGLEHMV